jgi:catechol 2,3-dioxygenase-like lactoylglutathione lyase family enzyme
MSQITATKITPNLIVSSVERSLAFYTDVLGFARGTTVPGESPFVFASATSGPVEIFLNDRSTVTKESPQMAGLSFGGGNTMFIEVVGIDALHDRVAPNVTVVMPIHTQWYGMREFAITDPDGYVITFAERVAHQS